MPHHQSPHLRLALPLLPEVVPLNSIPAELSAISLILSNPVANIFIISLILSYALPKKLDNDNDAGKRKEVEKDNEIEENSKLVIDSNK